VRPVIRTKDQAIAEAAADLRIVAARLEDLAGERDRVSMLPPSFPSPPPRPSLAQTLRAKRISLPATGAWVAVATLAIEVVRDLLRAYLAAH
jgi:hypothetical protein